MKTSNNTRIFGLIGNPLKHSFSPRYFEEKFRIEGFKNTVYQPFLLDKARDLIQLEIAHKIEGLNVTIPFKEDVIEFLDDLSPEAEAIGAVNCIQFKNGKRIGHNTDWIGFERSLFPLLQEEQKSALILGTGGASKAVAFALTNLGIGFSFVSTKKNTNAYSYLEAEKLLKNYSIIINTTPIGTFPEGGESPLVSLEGVGKNHLVYDLVYNPEKTRLLKLAEANGARIKNGLEMLEIQAEESWRIWNELS